LDKEQAKKEFSKLIAKFEDLKEKGELHTLNETDVSEIFILELFKALGWDIGNKDEVKRQETTRSSGRVDYSLKLRKRPILLFEIKKFVEKEGDELDRMLDGHYVIRGIKLTFPEQATQYGRAQKVDFVVLTNFSEIRLYYVYPKNTSDGLIFKIKYDEFLEKFDTIWQLSKIEIEKTSLEKIDIKKDRLDLHPEIEKELLEDLIDIRYNFIENFRKNNSSYNDAQINEAVYTLMNRLVVIRVCEDRDVIGFNSIYDDLEAWKKLNLSKSYYLQKLNFLFQSFGATYNTKLFEEHFSEKMIMDNKIIINAIEIFFKYNFDDIGADILGAIYEDYLSRVFKAEEKGVELNVANYDSKEIRKKDGIYYTPTYVVEYIVREALPAYLAQAQTPEEMSKIRICDPSCGSGSFLIKVFDIVKEWYEEFNQKLGSGLDDQSKAEYYYQKKILEQNIFGVDKDPQAAQIAAVNVFFKGVKKDVESPQMLGNNIKIGNSIISKDEEFEKIFGDVNDEKFIDWENDFSEKFDVIIGNPPHGAKLTKEERKYFEKTYSNLDTLKNTASTFIERCFHIMKPEGILALVLPKSILFTEGWLPVRNFVLENFRIIELIDLGKAFKGVKLEQMVLIAKKKTPTKEENVEELEDYLVRGTKLYDNGEFDVFKVPIKLFKKSDSYLIQVNSEQSSIFEKLNSFPKLGGYIQHNRGIAVSGGDNARIEDKTNFPAFAGKDIQRYFAYPPKFLKEEIIDVENNRVRSLLRPKILTQRIVAHVENPIDHIIIMSYHDKAGILSIETVENTFTYNYCPCGYCPKIFREYIVSLLNSRLISWYAYMFIFSKAIRTVDFDSYYISKIPIKIISESEQEKFIESVDKITKSIEKYVNIDESFNKFFKLEPETTPLSFHTLYRENLDTKDTETFDNSTVGSIKEVNVKLVNEWTTISVNYQDREKNKKTIDVLKFNLHNETLSKFIEIWINLLVKNLGSGNIYEKILDLHIPRYDKDVDKNTEKIKKMLEPYQNAVNQKSELYAEIIEINSKIDNEIYKIFDLTDEEIKLIESETRPTIYLPS